MDLYHYFDKRDGPFRNLSDCASKEEAAEVLLRLREERPKAQLTGRTDIYMDRRQYLEKTARDLFVQMGGKPERQKPHYMVVEACPWLYTWFEEPDFVKIPIEEFDLTALSFTYGDMFPTFNPNINTDKEYHQKLYLYPGMVKLIEKYGLPQLWNGDGKYGPQRYIEVQVWSDKTIEKFRRQYEN